MQVKLDKKSLDVLEEKQKRRVAVAREIERRKAVENTIDELYDWIDELDEEVRDAKSVLRVAKKEANSAHYAKSKLETVASKRLDLLKDLKQQLRNAKDDLADESHQRASLERLQQIQVQIKRERPVGRKRRSCQVAGTHSPVDM